MRFFQLAPIGAGSAGPPGFPRQGSAWITTTAGFNEITSWRKRTSIWALTCRSMRSK
jgi:hypothetical protein